MDVVGRALLLFALGTAIFGAGAALASARGVMAGAPRSLALLTASRRSLYAVAIMAIACFLILEAAFIGPNLNYQVAFNHSSTTTPLMYRIAAPWASQEGSLLLWVTLLSIMATISIRTLRGRLRDVEPYALAVLLGICAFFTALLVFGAKPFAINKIPAGIDGVGLSPLLRYPTMMIHPPLLYSGYTLFTIPFAFAIGALAAGRLQGDWIVHTRKYALVAWVLLGTGKIRAIAMEMKYSTEYESI